MLLKIGWWNKHLKMGRVRHTGPFREPSVPNDVPDGPDYPSGVIYDEEFIKNDSLESIKEPASFTPYAQDYTHELRTSRSYPWF